MNARQQRVLARLSPRARDLYQRVARGHWYRVYDRNGEDAQTPKAMAELVAAGLVTSMARVSAFEACYVPTGTKPPRCEILPEHQP